MLLQMKRTIADAVSVDPTKAAAHAAEKQSAENGIGKENTDITYNMKISPIVSIILTCLLAKNLKNRDWLKQLTISA